MLIWWIPFVMYNCCFQDSAAVSAYINLFVASIHYASICLYKIHNTHGMELAIIFVVYFSGEPATGK